MSTGTGYQDKERSGNGDRSGWVPGGKDGEREWNTAIQEWEWTCGSQASNPERMLRQSHDMATLGLMVGTVTHEVNNFLTAIMGATQLLEMSDADPSRKVYYQNILRMSERIRDLLQGIKNFSRRSVPTRSLTDIRKPIERAITLVENLLSAQSIRLVRAFPPDLPAIIGNADQLEQVFLNLFQNAVHAMEHGGVLTVSAFIQEEEVVVVVADTGCGIPTEHMGKVFEVFFTTKPDGQGTGLGLAICRRIVREHGGQVDVESAVGAGTRFTVRFPVPEGEG